MTADRPATEPRTEAEVNRKAREIVGLFDEPTEERPMTDAGRLAHAELHRFSHATATPCPGPECPHKRLILAIEAEAAQGAAPEPHRDYAGRTCTTGLLHDHSEGAAPRAEGLDAQAAELLNALAERNIYSRGDLEDYLLDKELTGG